MKVKKCMFKKKRICVHDPLTPFKIKWLIKCLQMEMHMYNPINKYIIYSSKLITLSPKVKSVPLKSTVIFCLEKHISSEGGNESNVVNV